MELKNVEIKSIGGIQTFGEKGFKVVKFVVKEDSNGRLSASVGVTMYTRQGREPYQVQQGR